MEKIVCKGIKGKKETELTCSREKRSDRWTVLVNGERQDRAEAFISVYAEKQIPFAGTCCPDDKNSIYYAMSAVERYFDRSARFVELISEELMPFEPGVVY